MGGDHDMPAGVASGAWPATLRYVGQIARSAEQLCFFGAPTPTGAWSEDAWLSNAIDELKSSSIEARPEQDR